MVNTVVAKAQQQLDVELVQIYGIILENVHYFGSLLSHLILPSCHVCFSFNIDVIKVERSQRECVYCVLLLVHHAQLSLFISEYCYGNAHPPSPHPTPLAPHPNKVFLFVCLFGSLGFFSGLAFVLPCSISRCINQRLVCVADFLCLVCCIAFLHSGKHPVINTSISKQMGGSPIGVERAKLMDLGGGSGGGGGGVL